MALVPAPQAVRLDAADLAVIIRGDLKRAYRGVKFSVTTDRYSMGSSVRIHWTDGPPIETVDRLLDRYCTQGFDGMTDSTTNRGPVRLDDGRLVMIYAYVTTSRSFSADLRARVAAWLERHPEADPGDGDYRILRRASLIAGCLVIDREAVRS